MDDHSHLGETSVGLIEMCTSPSFSSSDQKCFIPHHIRSVWIISFCLAVGAIALLLLTVLLLLTSQYARVSTVEYGRLTGFIASTTSVAFSGESSQLMFSPSDLPVFLNRSVSHGIRLRHHRWFTIPVADRLSHRPKLRGLCRSHLVDSRFSDRYGKNLSTSICSIISMYL